VWNYWDKVELREVWMEGGTVRWGGGVNRYVSFSNDYRRKALNFRLNTQFSGNGKKV